MRAVFLDIEQNTPEWFSARSGIPTASEFSKIMKADKKIQSTSFHGYAYKVADERMGGPDETEVFSNHWTKRGHDLEQNAINAYRFITGFDVRNGGFWYKDDRREVGCSPDAIVGDDGGAEFKNFSGPVHCECLHKKKIPSANISQTYGCLWVTGRDWWDFVSYHKRYEIFIHRVNKTDEDYVLWEKSFEKYIQKFIDLVNLITPVDTFIDDVKASLALDLPATIPFTG